MYLSPFTKLTPVFCTYQNLLVLVLVLVFEYIQNECTHSAEPLPQVCMIGNRQTDKMVTVTFLSAYVDDG